MQADQIELARQVFQQDRDDALVAPSGRVFRQPSDLLVYTHDELIKREKRDRNVQKTRSIIVAGGSKHHSSATLESLQNVPLSELKLPGVNRGEGRPDCGDSQADIDRRQERFAQDLFGIM